jgi:hypothetical protein
MSKITKSPIAPVTTLQYEALADPATTPITEEQAKAIVNTYDLGSVALILGRWTHGKLEGNAKQILEQGLANRFKSEFETKSSDAKHATLTGMAHGVCGSGGYGPPGGCAKFGAVEARSLDTLGGSMPTELGKNRPLANAIAQEHRSFIGEFAAELGVSNLSSIVELTVNGEKFYEVKLFNPDNYAQKIVSFRESGEIVGAQETPGEVQTWEDLGRRFQGLSFSSPQDLLPWY